MGAGWIKLYKQMLGWEWFKDSPTLHVFLYLLLSANFEGREWQGKALERGQVITSLRVIAAGTGLSLQQVRTAIGKLLSTHEITQTATHRNTIITICNYERYQAKTDAEQHTEQHTLQHAEQHTHIIRNKEDKNKEKTNTSISPKERFNPPSVDDVRAYCTERGNGIDAEHFVAYYTSNGWIVGRTKMKDWRAAIRTWEIKDKANGNNSISYERRRGTSVPRKPDYTKGF